MMELWQKDTNISSVELPIEFHWPIIEFNGTQLLSITWVHYEKLNSTALPHFHWIQQAGQLNQRLFNWTRTWLSWIAPLISQIGFNWLVHWIQFVVQFQLRWFQLLSISWVRYEMLNSTALPQFHWIQLADQLN